MYGTSILQGGCVSRPGMAYTAILGRRLDRQVVNLGFSGNALLDPEIAEWMARMEDPSVFVLDFAPNSPAERIDAEGERFFRILRDAHPDVPVVFVDMTPYPYRVFDLKCAKWLSSRSAAMKRLYDKLKASGEKRIWFIPGDKMIGSDGDASVDGTHLTDLGAERYVDLVLPVLRKVLRRSRID